MLDIKFIRENPEVVKKGIAKKDADISLVDKAVAVDARRRSLQTELDQIKAEKNKLGREINKLSAEQRDARIAALRVQDVKAESLGDELKKAEAQLNGLLYQIPNIPDEDVPVGRDETGNVIVKTVGEPRNFDFDVADYMALAREMDIIDSETAAKVSGSRFGYLKGAAAMLEFALGQFALNTFTNPEIVAKIAASVDANLSTKAFVPVVPPVMIREETYLKTARIDAGARQETYFIPEDQLYLIASAEHTLVAMHMDEVIGENQLPLRYLGFSTAFRREAGSYGKDTKGIFRVHQFDKWEMEIFVQPDLARLEYEFAVACEEYLLQQLNLPYQVIFKCTADIGGPNARGVDMNVWFPSERQYRETHTADYMRDYQARRLNTRLRRKDGSLEFVHNIDATVFSQRPILAIIENYQQADGSIEVPKVLQPYLPFKVIKGPWGMG